METMQPNGMPLLGDDFPLIDGILHYKLGYSPKFEVDASAPVTKDCTIPFEEIYINSDGSLGLCCKDYFDEINFGSLLEYDFWDLYTSNAFENIRRMHRTKKFPENHICRSCLLFGEHHA